MGAWSALIGVSVLTTYQRHFFDVPTGALLGLFCVRLWPEGKRPLLEDPQLTGGGCPASADSVRQSGLRTPVPDTRRTPERREQSTRENAP
jgi:hypothetical protein